MKKVRKIILVIVLLIVLAYTVNITSMPYSVILFNGDTLNLGNMFGIQTFERPRTNAVVASGRPSPLAVAVQTKTMELSLFGIIPVGEVDVYKIEPAQVIPLGDIVGIRLYTEGALVIGFAEIEGQQPYLDSEIEEGDVIIAINESRVTTAVELSEVVNRYRGEAIQVRYIRDGEEFVTEIMPARSEHGEYKLGLWVRDGAVRNRYGNLF